MAQQLQNITVQAPGFAGINSEDSPLSLDQSFAATASNCIIDSSGRVGSRKGYTAVSTNNTVLGTSLGIEAVHESVDASGDKVVFAAGNNKIFKLGANDALTDMTPNGYTINANNWKIVDFNNHTYFFQRGQAPLLYTDEGGIAGDGTLESIANHSHATGTAPSGNEVLAAYGRLWVADIVGDKKTVHFSGLLSGHNWNSEGAGTLNLLDVLPNGDDEIVALAAHNGFLIIFCKRCIVVYSNAETIASIQLADTVEGVGCIARDSVQHTGTDILFLSDNGVRSFGRTIQEKSMPMRDISNNVRSELMQIVNQQTNPIKSLYSADEAFYLLSLSDSQTVYCFDMKQALPDGANRVTTWSGINPRRVVMITWVITGILATVAGALYGLDKSYKPFTYMYLVLPVFASAILGGVGNPVGAIVGGYVIAFSELIFTFAYKKVFTYMLPDHLAPKGLVQLLSTDYKIAVSFVILVIVLLIKPTGIFSGKTI